LLASAIRCAAVVGGVVELAGKALDHRLLGSTAGVEDDPAHAERYTSRRTHLDGHLIGGAADASRAHLDDRLHVVERALEDAERLFLGALLDELERAIEGALGKALLAADHDRVHELRDQPIVELRIGQDVTAANFSFAWHDRTYFGFLAPYFERPCRRSCTPMESSVPRTTW
jgi:hypothetical protein